MSLQVEEWGVGPGVLLLHGAPSPVEDFAPIIERLRATHRVIAPHLPGYGRSAPIRPYSFASVRAAIVECLHARDVRRVSIVGFSMGAIHALELALDPGLDVSQVIVLGGLAGYSDQDREQGRGFVELLRTRPDLRQPEFRAIAAARFTSRPELGDAVADWLALVQPDVLADELGASLATDLRPRLADIAARVAVRTGALDVVTPPSYAQDLAGRCPNATLEIVPGVGHAQCLEDPAGTAEFVARALGLPARAG